MVNLTIDSIKDTLKEESIKFLLSQKVSDDTKIGSKFWKDIKAEVLKDDNFNQSQWYSDLDNDQKIFIKELKSI